MRVAAGLEFFRFSKSGKKTYFYISCKKCQTLSTSYWSAQQVFDSHWLDECANSTLAYLAGGISKTPAVSNSIFITG